MKDRKGRKLFVGDVVKITSREIPGLGIYDEGVIASFDKPRHDGQDITLVASRSGLPVVLGATARAVRLADNQEEKKIEYRSALRMFNEMNELVSA